MLTLLPTYICMANIKNSCGTSCGLANTKKTYSKPHHENTMDVGLNPYLSKEDILLNRPLTYLPGLFYKEKLTAVVPINVSINFLVASLTNFSLHTDPRTITDVLNPLARCRKLTDTRYCCWNCCMAGEETSGRGWGTVVAASSNMKTRGNNS